MIVFAGMSNMAFVATAFILGAILDQLGVITGTRDKRFLEAGIVIIPTFGLAFLVEATLRPHVIKLGLVHANKYRPLPFRFTSWSAWCMMGVLAFMTQHVFVGAAFNVCGIAVLCWYAYARKRMLSERKCATSKAG
jgi:hypothetical protein